MLALLSLPVLFIVSYLIVVDFRLLEHSETLKPNMKYVVEAPLAKDIIEFYD